MCETCSKLRTSAYSGIISKYMLEDVQRLMNTNDNYMATKPEDSGAARDNTYAPLLFSQEDFPFIEPLLYLEPRVALPKPTRYYQAMRVDGKDLRMDWSSGSMQALGFKDGSVILLAKAVVKNMGEAERLSHYVLAKLRKDELKTTEASNVLTIAFKGHMDGIDIKSRKIEGHDIEFSFRHHNNENAIVPVAAVSASAIYGGKARVQSSTAILSRFENYSITVPHFAPHPLLLQAHKELGFGSAMEMQKAVYKMLKQHLL